MQHNQSVECVKWESKELEMLIQTTNMYVKESCEKSSTKQRVVKQNK